MTYFLLLATAIISFMGLWVPSLQEKFIFSTKSIKQNNEWYRFLSSGLIHADIPHLLCNMYTLYIFGIALETILQSPLYFGNKGLYIFALLYCTALVVCLIPTYIKQRKNEYYHCLGASGAVSAIVFAFIVIFPTTQIELILLPGIHTPAFIFALLFIGASFYLSKTGHGNINHSAHLWGALYGMIFIWGASSIFSTIDLKTTFVSQIKYYLSTIF
ncbi:MAG: rhomboid family intramembrane serine protease [Phycisphaerales bacterium]|nr:rhomboid family intramembrane serine protease [Phycisphaerales bacterium]